MIPKEFYKEYMPLYTKDFDTKIYSTTQQSNSYRIDIRFDEKFNNYVYFFKIFGVSGKLLTMNGWTLVKARFQKNWYENLSPYVTIKDSQGIVLDDYQLEMPFAQTEPNIGGEIENRLREIFHFMKYISKFQSLYDFETVHKAPLSNICDVMHFYLEYLKIRNRLPQEAQTYIIDTIKTRFENYLDEVNK